MTKLDITISDLVVAVLTGIALIFCITIFNGANAESISKSKYQSLDKNLNTEYKAAKVRCEPLVGNAQALCDTKAESARDIAKAELVASFKPTIQNRYSADLVSANARFAIANEQCKGMQEVAIDACEKVAKELHSIDVVSATAQRNKENSGEIKKDKTVKLDEFGYKSNPFITVEFDNIYHVKA